jgi:hypothetical protein
MSKLAALAAKRRQKENTKSTETGFDSKMPKDENSSRLSALHISAAKPFDCNKPLEVTSAQNIPEKPAFTKLQQSQRINPNITRKTEPINYPLEDFSCAREAAQIRAIPSPFARMLLGDSGSEVDTSFSFITTSNSSDAKSFDFVEPSPDDVVSKAQNTKGWNQG